MGEVITFPRQHREKAVVDLERVRANVERMKAKGFSEDMALEIEAMRLGGVGKALKNGD